MSLRKKQQINLDTECNTHGTGALISSSLISIFAAIRYHDSQLDPPGDDAHDDDIPASFLHQDGVSTMKPDNVSPTVNTMVAPLKSVVLDNRFWQESPRCHSCSLSLRDDAIHCTKKSLYFIFAQVTFARHPNKNLTKSVILKRNGSRVVALVTCGGSRRIIYDRKMSASFGSKCKPQQIQRELTFCGPLSNEPRGVLLFAWHWNGSEMRTQSSQTEALVVKDSAEKTDPHSTLRQISSNAKAAIHLEGSYDEDVSSQDKLEWKNGQGQAFAQGGFRLMENQIIIPQTGLYFVYSQASFRVSCDDDSKDGAGKRLTPLSHRIWRYSDSLGFNASLMSAVRSACQTAAQGDSHRDGQGWYNTIYLGAVFQLYKGDKLWTETNMLSELETEEGKTFFGVFAL
ncbi:hypothetical protein F2P81_002581 [Scophthalmus maximus]|uniref:Tumor necrosis factor n=1 Tax=Scophthalmus maximus TaxID=52904 RepID=A0A6A4TVJ0_SCOMX|nr:hypothetical protein F2P81_002581 [Scophthalmus maximus]